jgi:hypothetical protein
VTSPDAPASSASSRWLNWWFRDRRSGHIVIAQFPNTALWVWLGCFALQAFGSLTGDAALLVRGAGRAALAIWALDEIVRGCNPFRRVLGGFVLTVSLIGWFTA